MTEEKKSNILLVDDKPANLFALNILLKPLIVNIFKASSGKEALAYIMKTSFSLILLDVLMPDMSGYETAELIRQNEDHEHCPIIFVTAIDEKDKLDFEDKNVDYILKPIDPDELMTKVKVRLDEPIIAI